MDPGGHPERLVGGDRAEDADGRTRGEIGEGGQEKKCCFKKKQLIVWSLAVSDWGLAQRLALDRDWTGMAQWAGITITIKLLRYHRKTD